MNTIIKKKTVLLLAAVFIAGFFMMMIPVVSYGDAVADDWQAESDDVAESSKPDIDTPSSYENNTAPKEPDTYSSPSTGNTTTPTQPNTYSSPSTGTTAVPGERNTYLAPSTDSLLKVHGDRSASQDRNPLLDSITESKVPCYELLPKHYKVKEPKINDNKARESFLEYEKSTPTSAWNVFLDNCEKWATLHMIPGAEDLADYTQSSFAQYLLENPEFWEWSEDDIAEILWGNYDSPHETLFLQVLDRVFRIINETPFSMDSRVISATIVIDWINYHSQEINESNVVNYMNYLYYSSKIKAPIYVLLHDQVDREIDESYAKYYLDEYLFNKGAPFVYELYDSNLSLKYDWNSLLSQPNDVVQWLWEERDCN